MKKLIIAASMTLALNFVALVGYTGWLYKSGRLDKEKIAAIKEMIYAEKPATAPSTQPASAGASTRPAMMSLDEMLAKRSGMAAADQIQFMRQAFDEQAAIVERRQRELDDLQRQCLAEKQRLAEDRTALATERKKFQDQAKAADQLAADKGFQETLDRYNALPPKQVKAIFMALEDQTVVNYLRAMDERAAAKVMKEFKSADETDRLKRIMEKMRTASTSAS